MRETTLKRSVCLQTLALVLLLGTLWSAMAASEHRFSVLKVGTQAYQNVTVTTKARDYIFILHSAGMTNIKVADLPEEVRAELGYVAPAPEKNALQRAGAAVPKIDKAEVEKIEKQINQALGPSRHLPSISALPAWIIYSVLGGLLGLYLFFCYCSMLICEKTGNKPGLLVWIPVLQMIPLYKAAGMSGAWFFALFVPVLNIVAQVIWSFRIVQARSKGPAISIMLLLPVLNVIAYLYLAFSEADLPEKETSKKIQMGGPQLMTLETA